MCYPVRLMQRRKAVVMTAIVGQRAVTRGLEKASLNHGGPAPSAVEVGVRYSIGRKTQVSDDLEILRPRHLEPECNHTVAGIERYQQDEHCEIKQQVPKASFQKILEPWPPVARFFGRKWQRWESSQHP